jgi:hypothetical protein
MRNLGFVILTIGIVMMLITGFNFVTTKNVANIGPVHINKEENHPLQWSPIVGLVLLATGAVIVLSDRRKS